jgi:hypothetical protein
MGRVITFAVAGRRYFREENKPTKEAFHANSVINESDISSRRFSIANTKSSVSPTFHLIILTNFPNRSRDSAVGTATGYGLAGRDVGIRVQIK